jgi:sarcosine oxidase gamma subunit
MDRRGFEHGAAFAAQPRNGSLHKVTLGSRIRTIGLHPHTIVDLNRANGTLVSQWDLPRDGEPVDLVALHEPAHSSTLDGRWVFVNRGPAGTVSWDMSQQPPRSSADARQVVGSGPGQWLIVNDADAGATARDLSANPFNDVALHQPVSRVTAGPGTWTVLDSGNGRYTAWQLTAAQPVAVSLLDAPGKMTSLDVAGGDWVLVHQSVAPPHHGLATRRPGAFGDGPGSTSLARS